MRPLDVIVKPLEIVAGREYPTSPVTEVYGRDLQHEQALFEERTDFYMDVLRFEGVKRGLAWLAGKKFPDGERIRNEISSGCDGPFDVDYNVHYHRREFGKSLLRLEGLRQAIQQRRKN